MGKKPAKMRDLEKTRKEILQATFALVFRNGFQGVSIDDIVKNTSLTKGALYHQFPTKLELGYALVDEVIKPMILERWISPLHSFENPLEGILQQMNQLIGKAKPENLKLGCPLNNLIQEMSPVDATFKFHLHSALTIWIKELEKQLERAKKNGYIKKNINCGEAAKFIVMAHEGFYGMLKGLDDPKAYKTLSHSLQIYFDAIQVNC